MIAKNTASNVTPMVQAPAPAPNATLDSNRGPVPVVAHVSIGRPLKSLAMDGAAYTVGAVAATAGSALILGGLFKFVLKPAGVFLINTFGKKTTPSQA